MFLESFEALERFNFDELPVDQQGVKTVPPGPFCDIGVVPFSRLDQWRHHFDGTLAILRGFTDSGDNGSDTLFLDLLS